jgi:hypothetical protein
MRCPLQPGVRSARGSHGRCFLLCCPPAGCYASRREIAKTRHRYCFDLHPKMHPNWILTTSPGKNQNGNKVRSGCAAVAFCGERGGSATKANFNGLAVANYLKGALIANGYFLKSLIGRAVSREMGAAR